MEGIGYGGYVDSGDRLMGWAALMSDNYVCVCNGWIHASFSFVSKGGQVRVKKS